MKRLKKILALAIAMAMVVASMSLSAFAATGDYQITVDNTGNSEMSINGKTYSAYKVFSLTLGAEDTTTDPTTYGAYAYSIKNTDWAFETLTNGATTNEDTGVITTTYGIVLTPSAADPTTYSVNGDGLTDANTRLLADALQSVLPGTADGSAQGASEKAVINLSEAGWYAVYGTVVPTDPKSTEEVVAAVGLTTTDKKVTVNPKASVPTLDKKITGVTEDGEVLDADGRAAVAKVGAKVSYQLDSKTPDLTGYETYIFKITDTLTDGLDYDNASLSSLVVKIDGTTIPATTETEGEGGTTVTKRNYTLAVNGRSFTLTIAYDTLKAAGKGKDIVVTYDAIVNSNALTTDYENNTANLEYSNNPYNEGEGKTNKTPDKKTYVIDINLDVDKIANGVTTKKLDGATFKLYKNVTTGATEDDYEEATTWEDGVEYFTFDGTTYIAVQYNSQEDMDSAGETVYKLVPGAEGTTSKMYYKWDNNRVTWVATQAAGDAFTTNAQGKLTQQVRGLDKGTYYLEETVAPQGFNLLAEPVEVVISVSEANDKVTYSATYGGAAATMTNQQVDLTAAQNSNQPLATGVISNESGTELPSTGGIGTTIFYVVGAILVIGAGVVLITKRRMEA